MTRTTAVFLQLRYSSRRMSRSKEQWDSLEFHLSSTSLVLLWPRVAVKRSVKPDVIYHHCVNKTKPNTRLTASFLGQPE